MVLPERLPFFVTPTPASRCVTVLLLHADEYSNDFIVSLQRFSAIFLVRYVVEQLRCLGILQTCEVLKVGMPTRVTYAELKEVRRKQVVQSSHA